MTEKRRMELVLPGKTPGLFCDAVVYGELLFTSGTAPRNFDGTIFAPGDSQAQARYLFETLEKVLAMVGSTFRDVLKMTIYLRNMEDRLKINPLRQEFFNGARPASTVVEVSALAHPDMMVEIEMVAVARKYPE
ncbi:MAG: RidA family protein [Peptococcaceae bacterium]|nr:RidA family protein [Peptococcaceae bacterium]